MASEIVRVGGTVSRADLEDRYMRLKARVQSFRHHTDAQGARIQRMGVMAVGAYAFGKLERSYTTRGETMMTVAGLNPKLSWGAALFIAAPMIGGRAGEVMESVSEAIIATYAYETGKAPPTP